MRIDSCRFVKTRIILQEFFFLKLIASLCWNLGVWTPRKTVATAPTPTFGIHFFEFKKSHGESIRSSKRPCRRALSWRFSRNRNNGAPNSFPKDGWGIGETSNYEKDLICRDFFFIHIQTTPKKKAKPSTKRFSRKQHQSPSSKRPE